MNAKPKKIFLYVLHIHIYVYVIVYVLRIRNCTRKRIRCVFDFALNFQRVSPIWRPLTLVSFGWKRFLAPQIPVKLEVKSRFPEYTKKVPFDWLLRDWFSAYSDFKFRSKKILIKTNICSIIICEVKIWQRALSSMTCSSLAMTHPRVKKRCFFFFTIIGEFLYDVSLQISENF